jgi:hypothetical protein
VKIILPLIILALALAGCSRKSELTRSDAAQIIASGLASSDIHTKVALHSAGFQKGFYHGMWTQSGLTPKGAEFFRNFEGDSILLKAPVHVQVEITGIADGLLPNTKEVGFVWRYGDIPSVAKRYVVDGGSGTAVLRLYDDGWRLEHIEYNYSRNPATLSQSERADEQKEEATIAEKIRQENEAKHAEMLRVEKIVEQSKIPTTTLADYSLPPPERGMRGQGQPAQIILTDVCVELRYREDDQDVSQKVQQLWFGDFLFRDDIPSTGWFRIRQRSQNYGYIEKCFFFSDGATAKKFADQLDNAISAWRKRFPEACK